jgi:hypothetical protein
MWGVKFSRVAIQSFQAMTCAFSNYAITSYFGFYQMWQGRIWSRNYKSPSSPSSSDRFRFSNFDFLDQTLCHLCQFWHFWPKSIAIISIMMFFTRYHVIYNFLRQTSYSSCHIWHFWPDLMSFMSNLTFLTTKQTNLHKFSFCDDQTAQQALL